MGRLIIRAAHLPGQFAIPEPCLTNQTVFIVTPSYSPRTPVPPNTTYLTTYARNIREVCVCFTLVRGTLHGWSWPIFPPDDQYPGLRFCVTILGFQPREKVLSQKPNFGSHCCSSRSGLARQTCAEVMSIFAPGFACKSTSASISQRKSFTPPGSIEPQAAKKNYLNPNEVDACQQSFPLRQAILFRGFKEDYQCFLLHSAHTSTHEGNNVRIAGQGQTAYLCLKIRKASILALSPT